MSSREPRRGGRGVGQGGRGDDHDGTAASHITMRLAMAIILVCAVLLSTAIAATLSRWWVERDVAHLLEDLGWRPPGSHPARTLRARIIAEVFANMGFGKRLTDSIIVSGLIGATLAGAVGFFGATRLTRPLTSLANRLRRLAAGDFGRGSGSPASGVREVVAISSAVDSLSSQLEAAETLRVRLVEDLVHELRNPLAAVRGYAEGLRDEVFTEPALAVDGLERELRRIERLLSDLRHSALPSTPGSFVPVDLGELAQAVAAGFTSRAAEGQIRLEVRPAPANLMVGGDPDRLSQLVSNLLDNAVKFTPVGGRVLVETAPSAHREEVTLIVEDTGPGIPPADLPHIFDRLYRSDGSRARSTGGSGIGLAIARQIALSHSGTIEVHNVSGAGARFTVRLPRVHNTARLH